MRFTIIQRLPSDIKEGDFIIYSNGNNGSYTGTVMEVKENSLILLDESNAASVILWKSGFAVGTEIYADQIKQVIPADETETSNATI